MPKFFSPRIAKTTIDPPIIASDSKSGDPAFAEEIELLLRYQIEHRKLLQPELFNQPAECGAREEQGRKHGGDDAKRESNGEAFHRTRRLPEEDDGGNERGDIGVKDCAEGFVVGGLQRCGQGFACSRFLAEPFIDENVRIDGHAHGENDARDARQREHKMKHRHRAEEDDHVNQEAKEGHDACETVVDHDEGEDERQAGQSSQDAAANGVRPQRRRNAARFFEPPPGTRSGFSSALARSLASLSVKRPVITALPP